MDIIQENFAKIIGKPCWGLTYDSQTNLWMEFGNPKLEMCKPRVSKSWLLNDKKFKSRHIYLSGDWRLWIYMSYWKISLNGEKLSTSSSSLARIKSSMAMLKGQILEKVSVKYETGATKFRFDLGALLEVRRFGKDSEDELWMLLKPNNYMLSITGDGNYIHQLGSKSGGKRVEFIK